MIVTDVYEELKDRMAVRSKSEFSRSAFGARNTLAMIEHRGRISPSAREKLVDALRSMGHMDLVFMLLIHEIRQRMPGRPAAPEHLFTATIITPTTTDPAMAICELRGQNFPVRHRKVMPNSRPDAVYGEYVLETSDEGAIYAILSGWARPGRS